MQVELIEASIEHRPSMVRLLELYLYDFSEFMNWDVDENGSFGEDDLDGCWTENWRHPYLIYSDGKLAGFAIVDEYSQDAHDFVDMGEFFIMRRFRRHGLGKQIAFMLFDKFANKTWQVEQLTQNTSATAFLRKIIHDYTNGDYQEYQTSDGIAQHFVSSKQE